MWTHSEPPFLYLISSLNVDVLRLCNVLHRLVETCILKQFETVPLIVRKALQKAERDGKECRNAEQGTECFNHVLLGRWHESLCKLLADLLTYDTRYAAHTYTHIYMYIYTYTYTHTHTHIYIYTYKYKYKYTYIHTYIYIHIYTYIYIYTDTTVLHWHLIYTYICSVLFWRYHSASNFREVQVLQTAVFRVMCMRDMRMSMCVLQCAATDLCCVVTYYTALHCTVTQRNAK